MTNIEALRKILEPLENEEAKEFLEAIEEEIVNLKDQRSALKEQVRELESEIDDDGDEFDGFGGYENLGLDSINYRFDHGNMAIKMSFDEWVASVKKSNLSGIAILK